MWIYAFLGAVQGIFEWIPISSQGIVALLSQLFIKDFSPIDVALFLHMGTFFAVLIYFRKDWKQVLLLRDKSLLRFLAISTIISLAIGFLLYNLVGDMFLGSGLLLLTGIGLLFTACFHRQKRTFKISSGKLALVAGALQGLAVIPGLSRSASTIFALSLGKEKPLEILKISYMMSAPIVLASSVYLFLKNPTMLFDGWLALIFSFLVGLVSLRILFKFSKKINFFKFAVFFSLLCFIGALIGFLF